MPLGAIARQKRRRKTLPLCVVGFVGMFIVRLRQRVRIILTRTEVHHHTALYDRSEGMNSVALIKNKLTQVGALLSESEVRSLLHRVSYREGLVVSLQQWLRLNLLVKRNGIIEAKNETDTHNAFSALGDGQGHVDASKFKRIVKDFDLAIDIDKFIEETDTDHSGQLNYAEFAVILTEMFGKEECEALDASPKKTQQTIAEPLQSAALIGVTAEKAMSLLQELALTAERPVAIVQIDKESKLLDILLDKELKSLLLPAMSLRKSSVAVRPVRVASAMDLKEDSSHSIVTTKNIGTEDDNVAPLPIPARTPRPPAKSTSNPRAFTCKLQPLPPPTGSSHPVPARPHPSESVLPRQRRYKAFSHDEMHLLQRKEFKEQRRQRTALAKRRKRKGGSFSDADAWQRFNPFQTCQSVPVVYVGLKKHSLLDTTESRTALRDFTALPPVLGLLAQRLLGQPHHRPGPHAPRPAAPMGKHDATHVVLLPVGTSAAVPLASAEVYDGCITRPPPPAAAVPEEDAVLLAEEEDDAFPDEGGALPDGITTIQQPAPVPMTDTALLYETPEKEDTTDTTQGLTKHDVTPIADITDECAKKSSSPSKEVPTGNTSSGAQKLDDLTAVECPPIKDDKPQV